MLLPVLALGGLDVLPPRLLRHAVSLGRLVPEDVWMAALQLVGDGVGHVVEGEQPLFLGHAGVENRLEQQVAQFGLQFVHVAPLDGVGDFIGLLDRIGGDGGEGLLHVPWASADRGAQLRHDADQAVDRARRGVAHEPACGVAPRASSAARI